MINPKRPIILIGGSPTAGKSTLANSIAKQLNIPWISTDQIRDIMRLVANRKEYPLLFNPEGYTAERFLKEFSPKEIVDMEYKQSEAVWPVVKAFIEKDYTWESGFVMEGVNILPHLVRRDFQDNENIKAIFVVDEDVIRVREVIFSRGLWSDARSYPDDVKEKEVEWVLLFSKRIKEDAKKHGYFWMQVNKNDKDLLSCINAIQKI